MSVSNTIWKLENKCLKIYRSESWIMGAITCGVIKNCWVEIKWIEKVKKEDVKRKLTVGTAFFRK